MPASQAGRRRFDPGRPLHDFAFDFTGLEGSSENCTDSESAPTPKQHPKSAEVEPHRASVRSLDGEILGSTDASTICWVPRKPSALAAYDERAASTSFAAVGAAAVGSSIAGGQRNA